MTSSGNNLNKNNDLNDEKRKKNLIQVRSVFLRAYAELEAHAKRVAELQIQAITVKDEAVAQKADADKFKTTLSNLNQKVVRVDRKRLAARFPEFKDISAELQLLHDYQTEIQAHAHNAIVETDKVAEVLSKGRRGGDEVRIKTKQSGLTQIGSLSESTAVALLMSKQQIIDSIQRAALRESSALRELLKTTNLDQAEKDLGKTVKVLDKCKQVPIMSKFRELHDFVEVHTNMLDVYNQLVNTLKKSTDEYSAKAKGRYYSQASQRNASIDSLATLINDQTSHANQDPKRCLENLVVALKQQMDETQTSHRNGHWWSFFTTSALSVCYGNVFKTLPVDLQNISRANPFPQPQLSYVAV